MKIAVKLETKKQADLFFKYTGFPLGSCACVKNNWKYKKETAYDILEFDSGNVRYYQALDYEIISFSTFMRIRELTKSHINQNKLITHEENFITGDVIYPDTHLFAEKSNSN